jgi:hypothetical protein
MGCAAGYPEKPCPYDHTGKVTREACGACKNFIPPKHILAWCRLYDRDKVICKLPKSACATCPEKNERGSGRPPGEGKTDWKDKQSVNAYQAELMAKRRADGLDANKPMPASYHRDYYAKNRQRILERRRARRQGKGE